MSTFLTAQSLTLAHTSNALFTELNFTINRGDRIGLIGHNGCGKSSLLKLLCHQIEPSHGRVATANHCLMRYVEQHIPHHIYSTSILSAVAETLAEEDIWQAELLLEELGFTAQEWKLPVAQCSGGQQMRLLLARAIIHQPDLLLLDEPSNHLDLPSLLWLQRFLSKWKGSFILVSHDQTLLDSVTNKTWVLRDQTLHHFNLPCTAARSSLKQQDEADKQRHFSEQKEIDRIDKSAKRLALWGKIYDNEDLARKAKTMASRKERLQEEQTELSQTAPWRLALKGEALAANRLVDIAPFSVTPKSGDITLFEMTEKQIKSGDRIAILGENGGGKSSLLNQLFSRYSGASLSSVTFHDRCRLGYYDQSLNQLQDSDSIVDALLAFSSLNSEQCKRALISAGFEYARHSQVVASLSGGERARLLFVGLTLARYHLLFLDEPTNHLDMEGKEELITTLNNFGGAALLVSHDRSLIEQSCNRFWLIQQGKLTEHLSVDEAYTQIENGYRRYRSISDEDNITSPSQSRHLESKELFQCKPNSTTNEDHLLERLVELESLLEDDLKRRPKRQKVALQQKWREEISIITEKL
ncbi:ABC-F family ATP-binding cassette domain-containing protein [Vibrio sp. 404]|uniref:ABC-F family ATP-binding cassette domain-containing protein n=1 Tax=Vibrio marinisediminis TaxID=2758441 RepID=A0A7W2FMV8_9VIBR|nr:ABC-F family ATP-binding cassette domain-containing protein [Vibrio marinisediminis]MBA5761030.1 ABC-F family ATP-binding cassette domain-containing protein [Vibrio marinisediminis]